MIEFETIKEVHLELSSNCNASCPLCPRNFYGMPYNAGYEITELYLSDIKKIFEPKFVQQLTYLLVNGNLGDFMLARDSIEIIDYFRSVNPSINIDISTNGSARNADYWKTLAPLATKVSFCLDGLEDTHTIYRRDTQFERVLSNAKSFIDAGGNAEWKMVLFDHNQHQVEQAKQLSKQLGFKYFNLVDHGRNSGPVFDKNGNKVFHIGNSFDTGSTAKTYMKLISTPTLSAPVKDSISCMSKNLKTIYVAANGEVYPCCYLGFSPRTFKGYTGIEQIKELLGLFNNNAKEKPLKQCIEWFNLVEETWKKKTYEQGLLYRCNLHCGQD